MKNNKNLTNLMNSMRTDIFQRMTMQTLTRVAMLDFFLNVLSKGLFYLNNWGKIRKKILNVVTARWWVEYRTGGIGKATEWADREGHASSHHLYRPSSRPPSSDFPRLIWERSSDRSTLSTFDFHDVSPCIFLTLAVSPSFSRFITRDQSRPIENVR